MSFIETFWGHGPKGHEESTQQNIKTQKPQLESILCGKFHFKLKGYFLKITLEDFVAMTFLLVYLFVFVLFFKNILISRNKLPWVGDAFCEWFWSWKGEWLPKDRDKPPSSSRTYFTKNGYSKALPWLYQTPNTVGRHLMGKTTLQTLISSLVLPTDGR